MKNLKLLEIGNKKTECLEIELASSKHNCELLKNVVYGKRSEKHKDSYMQQMSFLFNEAEEYAECHPPPRDNKGSFHERSDQIAYNQSQ